MSKVLFALLLGIFAYLPSQAFAEGDGSAPAPTLYDDQDNDGVSDSVEQEQNANQGGEEGGEGSGE